MTFVEPDERLDLERARRRVAYFGSPYDDLPAWDFEEFRGVAGVAEAMPQLT